MKITQKARMNIFRLILEVILNYKYIFMLALIFYTLEYLCFKFFFFQYTSKIILMLTSANVLDKSILLSTFITLLLIWIGGFTFQFIANVFYNKIFPKIIKLREIMFKNIQNMPYNFFFKNKDGEIAKSIDIMTASMQNVIDFLLNILPTFIIITVILIKFITVHFLITIIVFLWAICHTSVTVYYFKKVQKISNLETEINTKIMSFIIGSFENQRIVEFFELRDDLNTMLKNLQNQDIKIQEQLLKTQNISLLWQEILLFIFEGIFFWCSLFYLFQNNYITLSDLIVCNNLNCCVMSTMWHISEKIPDFLYNVTKCQSVLRFFDSKATEFRRHQTLKIIHQKGEISIKNLSFSYDGIKIIDNFSLKIKPGSKILIMGYSGIGKSTFIDIISGILQDYTGDVFFDGINIKSLDKDFLKKYMSFITNYGLFNGTIKYNILLDKQLTPKELTLIQKDVILENFNLDTEISSSHCSLSDGEKQRVLIARGLVNKDAKILIGDEIFKGLDFPKKQLIIKVLKNFMLDKTSIIIDHSLVLVDIMDYIIFFGKDQKIHIGSYSDLSENNSEYKEFIKFDLGEN